MRLQSILMSAVVIVSLSPGIALAKFPSSTSPVKSTPVATPTAQSTPILEQLKLTDAQKLKLRGIRSAKTRKINQLLTVDQRTKLQQQLKSGQKMSEALKTLGLKPENLQKITAVRRNAAQQIKATLTTDQLKQLETYFKQHPSEPNSVE